MKTIARMVLKPGMEIGEDVLNSRGEVIVPAHTIVDATIISRLERHSVMAISVMDEIDYATTHFEKVRLSQAFKNFERLYLHLFPQYKEMMNNLVEKGTPVDTNILLQIYYILTEKVVSGRQLLDFLYNMVPSEDELTHTHCMNSALIAGVFADWLGMKTSEKEMLILCAYFYDIGKLKLPNSLLWKAGRLTDVEFARIKTHPFLGYEIVKDQDLDPHIFKSILMHHERCDGKGYPSRLKMQQIDFYARHISIIDAYEAMTSPRSYRQSLTPLEVVERFEDTGFMQYDHEILKPIMSRIADTQLGMTVKLSDDSIWEIFLPNQIRFSKPTLKREGKNGQLELLDLMQRTDLKIVSIF
ncbi:MAG: HD-GYP domain-containing protein [Lachnospiraceae bacterium]